MYHKSVSTRRTLLSLVGTAGITAVAGCGDQTGSETGSRPETSSSSETPTKTVVVTDDETATTTKTPESEEKIVYSGGGSKAFAEALDTAAQNPGTTIEIDPGIYELDPVTTPREGKRWHFEPQALTDVTINGNGATLLFQDPILGALKLTDGADVTIRDLTIDFDPVPFTQGEITGTADGGRTIVVTLDEGYPSLDHEMFSEVPEPNGLLKRPDGEFIRGIRSGGGRLDKFFSSFDRVGERQYELTLRDNSNTRGIETGNRLTITARNNHAVFSIETVARPTFENITLRSSNGAGFSIKVCSDPTVRGCVAAPPPESDRQIGCNADTVRIIDCLSTPTVEDCRLEYVGDDGIVVQHSMSTVTEFFDERTVDVSKWGLFAQPDDVFVALSPTGIVKGELPPLSDVEYKHGQQEGRGRVTAVTFADPVDEILEVGDHLGNLATASREFTVRNNVVRNLRGHLIRIAASDGVVQGNTLEGSSFEAIELETDTNTAAFTPKGIVRDVTIRGNEISRSGLNYFAGDYPAGIRVHHEPLDEYTTEGSPNGDIEIVDNSVRNSAHMGVSVEHATNIRIEKNTLEELNQLEYSTGRYGIGLVNVDDVTVTENTVRGASDRLREFGFREESVNVGISNNEFSLNGEAESARFLSWLPVEFRFNRTVSPEGSDRSLAIRVYELSLLNENGDVIFETGVGNNESGIRFGSGVYFKEQADSETWRWFGGPNAVATLSLSNQDIADAETMVLQGTAIDDDIVAEVLVEGSRTDSVVFREGTPRRYEVNLS